MQIKTFKVLPSTNQKAKELAKKGAQPWTVIMAEEQSAGYGKEKVFWFSPRGGLYFSVILPKSQIKDLQTLTVLAAFIIARTLKEKFSLEPLIKLPNDVRLDGKKIAGILTENIIGRDVKLSVIGIGLNTNVNKFPQDLEDGATSLKIELGKEVNNQKILEEIVLGLKEQFKTISR
jgi:BirA family biotin operon repressor/biotin-[acetyl-CoA-carboxylase] ligase